MSRNVLPRNAEKRKRIETFTYLNERLRYDASSGLLYWKTLFSGREAGTEGDRCIKLALERLDFKAHRLCWILHYGEPPLDGYVVDHKNGDWSDNRIENLRLCKSAENSRNSRLPSNNTVGYKGVRRGKNGSRYYSFICFDRKQIHLGSFDHDYEAADAYNEAAEALFGEFARLNYHKLFASSEPRSDA